MRKILEEILVNLVEKLGVNGITRMNHHLILVTSLHFDINLIGNIHPCVELFLSKLERELFSFLLGKPQAYNNMNNIKVYG